MELKYEYLLYTHASAGGIALIAGLCAAFLKKGSKGHSRLGKTFACFMAFSAISALLLALWHPNPFLLGVGFFTLYLVSSGWIWIRRMPFGKKVKLAKAIGAAGILAAIYMFYVGMTGKSGGIILYVFAGILSIFSLADLVVKTAPNKAAGKHGGRMGGALVAAVTAFMATNVYFLPPLIVWLGPTVIGTPLIILGIRRFYTRSKSKNDEG